MRALHLGLLVPFIGASVAACSSTDFCSNEFCTAADGGADADAGSNDAVSMTDGIADAALEADQSSSDAPPDAPAETGITCDGGAILCGNACVDPTSPMHCGTCTNVCPVPTNGTATCAMPTCGIQCNAGYHACMGSCLPNSNEPGMDACVIDDAFGVFVAPNGSDSNACTKTSPCATITKGMTVAHAASKRVYVCEGTYNEQLVVDSTLDNIKVFGGFSCSWVYDVNKKPLVAPNAHGYAMVISTPTSALFEDFAFQAQSGSAAGESSIAIFAKNAAGVVLRRCNVTAGAGIAGQDQTQPAPYGSAAPNGNPGTLNTGGGVASNSACTSSVGGAGGQPAPTGQDGTDGTPGMSNKGTVTACQSTGTPGGPGGNGTAGNGGNGAATWATFGISGWAPSPGGVGATGTVAQGGGGGASLDLIGGGGGGGGGAGGCGGVGGGGGTGGGSSIALLAFSAGVDLETSTLQAANAGKGGAGATGQTGQTGGSRGAGYPAGNACSGGKGGNGGNGGTGGGGAGGLSAGIVWLGTAPTVNGTTTPSATTLSGFTTATPGTGGSGGNPGKAGVAAAVVQAQ